MKYRETDEGYALRYFHKLRAYNKNQSTTYCSICLKEELNLLLEDIMQHTSAIIILRLSNIDTIKKIMNDNIFFYIYNKSIVFENVICNNERKHKDNLQYNTEQYVYVLFQVYPHKDDGDLNIQHLVKQNKDVLFVSGYYQTQSGKHFIILSDVNPKSELSNIKNRNVAVLVRGGYGDIVMLFPILQAFIRNNKTKQIEVDILTPKPRVYKLLKKFLFDCNVKFLDLPSEDSFYMLLCHSFLNAGYYRDVYTITPNVIPNIQEPVHLTDIWKKALGVTDKGFVDRECVDSHVIPSNVLDMINEKKAKAFFCVGIQLYAEDREFKSWDISHILKFIDLCKNEKIFLINLVPMKWEIPLSVYDVSFLEFDQIFALTKHLDVVIGIDGCCCHMAGVLKVPNITIWGDEDPHCVDTRPVSFRSICMNYSLVSKDKLATSIPPEFVVERLKDLRTGKIQLQETLITIDDTLNGKNIEWI